MQDLYIVDSGNRKIRKCSVYEEEPKFTTFIGQTQQVTLMGAHRKALHQQRGIAILFLCFCVCTYRGVKGREGKGREGKGRGRGWVRSMESGLYKHHDAAILSLVPPGANGSQGAGCPVSRPPGPGP